MAGYTKNIAVIKELKSGFSADGSPLTGIIKAERYGSVLGIEVTFVNFAPLSEGRYVTAVTDGCTTLIVEDCFFEGVSELDTGKGFAALVCYVNGAVSPVASAVCGNFHAETLILKREVEKAENLRPSDDGAAMADERKDSVPYEDEAIAEVNYYEFAQSDESGDALFQDKKKTACGNESVQDEKAFGAFEKDEGGISPLARGNFYDRTKKEIEGILKAYPREEELCRVVKNSEWVRIYYGDERYYVFGVLYDERKPQYICYGVPAEKSDCPPESMKNMASFIPCSNVTGYWVMYQDAQTGAAIYLDIG